MIFLRAAQREFTQNAVAVFVALFAILISTVLIRLLGQAAGGRVPADAVLALIGFGAIAQMPVVLSLTLFIYKTAHPRVHKLHKGDPMLREGPAELPQGITVYMIEGTLFFGAIHELERLLQSYGLHDWAPQP